MIEERVARIDELLAGANFTNLALDTLEANIFDPSIAAIDEQFIDQPEVRAQLLNTIADTLHALGRLEAAMGPQERATKRGSMFAKRWKTTTAITSASTNTWTSASKMASS